MPRNKYLFTFLFSMSMNLSSAHSLASEYNKLTTNEPDSIQLLAKVQSKLTYEAAKLKIQGNGLGKAEINRLNILFQSIAKLKEISSQLESSALTFDTSESANPSPVKQEPKNATPNKPKKETKAPTKKIKAASKKVKPKLKPKPKPKPIQKKQPVKEK